MEPTVDGRTPARPKRATGEHIHQPPIPLEVKEHAVHHTVLDSRYIPLVIWRPGEWSGIHPWMVWPGRHGWYRLGIMSCTGLGWWEPCVSLVQWLVVLGRLLVVAQIDWLVWNPENCGIYYHINWCRISSINSREGIQYLLLYVLVITNANGFKPSEKS